MNWKSFLGGVALTTILIAAALGAYFLGQSQNLQNTDQPQQTTNAAKTNSPASQATPTPTAKPNIVTTGGLHSFIKYSVTTPEGWTAAKSGDGVNLDEIVISKGGSSIKIFQAATGGALCMYPGDAPFEGPSATYDTFTDLTTADGTTLRRGGDIGGLAFTICAKQNDNTFIAPTKYGHISVEVESEAILTQVDSILESLTKI